MKGYSSLTRAIEAAARLRERGYAVQIDVRNGWYVINFVDVRTTNDNAPPDAPEAA